MKIKTIKTLKNYKSFQDFSWHKFFNAENFHDDTNILYGENGSGKTSVCNILKSLSNYRDFSKYFPEEATVKIDDTEYKYSNQNWDNTIENGSILFFDKEFVNKNVHLGNDRGTHDGQQEQESGKLIIEFDAEAIKLRETREKLKIKRDEAEEAQKKFTEDNKDVLNFALSNEDSGLFQKHKDKTAQQLKERKKELTQTKKDTEKKLGTDQETQKRVDKIQTDISTFEIEDFDIQISNEQKYQSLFDFEIKEQAKVEAEKTLVDKLKEHKEFFEEGFEIRKTHPAKCPFCQSETEEESIKKVIKTYNDIYDDSYKKQLEKFKSEKNALLEEIDGILETVRDFNLGSIFLELKKLDQNYKIKDIYSVDEESSLKKPDTKKLQALKTKIQNLEKPSKEKIAEMHKAAAKEVEDINKFFTSLNALLEKKNKVIEKFKSDNTGQKIQDRIAKFSETLTKVEQEINFISQGLIEKQKQKLEKDKLLKALEKKFEDAKSSHKNAREKYEEYCSKEAFTKLLAKIEEYFKNFHFNLKLQLDTERRAGSTKEFPFAFKILDVEGNERDFKEGLSEGEWQVLSLCFFFSFLDIQQNKKEKILVFDDPITSLDNSNLSCLVDLIAKDGEGFSQVFVFTHHRTFFKFLRKRFFKKSHEYNILRNKKEFGGSFLCKSKEKKFIDELRGLEQHLQNIPPAELDMELKIVEYGQYLRYEVERFIKYGLLHWGAESRFDLAIDGLKNNRSISDDNLDKVKDVYSFCNWTTSHVDVGDDHGLDQLKTKITDFLTIFDSCTQAQGS